MNVFERASRVKMRFNYKGLITVEDLWDLDVKELDSIYKNLSSQKKQLSEDSLLDKQTTEDIKLKTAIDIVKYIVEYKLAKTEASKKAIETKQKKQKILEILANKQDDALQNKSEDELKEMLNDL